MAAHFLLLILLLGTHLSTCTIIYHSLSELTTTEYDFIIAGGGTAGLVVANRLTENPKIKVLVVEAGPSHEGILDLQVPFFSSRLSGATSPFAWNTTTTPQRGLLGRSILYSRGFVLGGSSSHNAMIWIRGSSDDYDKWAEVTGDKGWSWKSLLPYMKKVERWSPSSESPGFDKGKFDPSAHGFRGPLGVGITGIVHPVDELIIKAAQSKEFNLPFTDVNAGRSLGIWWLQSSVANGTRTSSATAYLDPIRDRPNLTVLVNTYVTRIMQATEGTFRVLEASQSPTGPRTKFFATREIILSGGVIGTPQILLNSGIGDSGELKNVGVEPTHHLPNVGKGLSNEPQTVYTWKANTTILDLRTNATVLEAALAQWNATRTGPLVTLGANLVTFFRLPKDSPLLKNNKDPAAGPNTPHYYMAAAANGYFATNAAPMVALVSHVAEPSSRGSITLKSNNPFEQPNVDLGFLDTDLDIGIALEAFRTAQKQATHPALQGFTMDRTGPPPEVTSDEDIVQFIRNTTRSTSHGVGTAAMSAKGSSGGVVDPDLRVKGIKGVRIVDASVIPFSPAANTQASVYCLAERASDLIKEVWKI